MSESTQSTTKVGYTDPQEIYPSIKDALAHQFPLHNLHWNPGDRPVRTITSLNVDMVPADHSQAQHQILGLSDAPIVQVLFIEAENTDIYRGKRRKLATDWRKQLDHLRDPTGWLVVYFVPPGQKRSKAVFQKMHSDFEDHATHIYLDTEPVDVALGPFIKALRAQILLVFGGRVHAYEEEIRKLQSTRDIVGWNFGTLFVMKESLAWSFEKMSFLEDAYQIYCELARMAEPTFFQDTDASDLPPDILAANRDVIIHNMLTQQASLFDFHSYLFSRQILLLLHISEQSALSSPSLAEKYIKKAISTSLQTLPFLFRLLASRSDKDHVLEWEFRTCQELYEIFSDFGKGKVDPQNGKLLLLQRDILQKTAAYHKVAIKGVFNDLTLDDDDYVKAEGVPEDQVYYTGKFIELTRKALVAFADARQEHSVQSLTAQLAFMYYDEGNLEEAFAMLKELRMSYGDRGWHALSVSLHFVYIDCARKVGDDTKVLELSWSVLQLQQYLSESQCQQCIQNIELLKSIAANEFDLDNWYEVLVRPWLQADGPYYLEVELNKRNKRLPFVPFETGTLTASLKNGKGPDARTIKFVCSDFSMQPLRFVANQFIEGAWELGALTMTFGSQTLVKRFAEPQTLYMVPLLSGIHARLQLSKQFTLTKRNLELEIASPCPISANVRVQAIDGLQILTEKMRSSGLDNFTKATVSVPCLLRVGSPKAVVRIIIDYNDGGLYQFDQDIDLSLCLEVHVQEFYRKSVVFYQFLVDSLVSCPIVVDQAKLSSSGLYEVLRSDIDQKFLALSGSPISYVFALQKSGDAVAKPQSDIVLVLNYRDTLWECRELLLRRLERFLDSVLMNYKFIFEKIFRLVPLDTIVYVTQEKLTVNVDELLRVATTELLPVDPVSVEKIRASFVAAFETPLSADELLPAQLSELNVSLEVTVPEPNIDVVHLVSAAFDKKESYLVGQDIAVEFKISPCFHWSAKSVLSADTVFQYEIMTFNDGWLLDGECRGFFTAEKTVTVRLIPNKPGSLSLPKVRVSLKEQAMEVGMDYLAETLLVLPSINRLAITF